MTQLLMEMGPVQPDAVLDVWCCVAIECEGGHRQESAGKRNKTKLSKSTLCKKTNIESTVQSVCPFVNACYSKDAHLLNSQFCQVQIFSGHVIIGLRINR